MPQNRAEKQKCMNLITYRPARDLAGRFIPSRKKVFKTLFVLASLVSFYANYALAKQIWNVKCAEGGYFTTKAKCEELAQAKFDAREYYRLQLSEALANERNDYEQ